MSELNMPPSDLSNFIEDIALRRLFAVSRVLWFTRYHDGEFGQANNGIYSCHCCRADLQRAGYRYHTAGNVWRRT